MAKTVSQFKCLEELKKLRFTLQLKSLLLHSVRGTWDTISEVTLGMKLEWCWDEKDLANQNLLITLSANTFSWNTRIWLNTISLATRRPDCCVVFFVSKLKAGDIITIGHYIYYQTFCNHHFKLLLKNSFFLVLTFNWGTGAEKNRCFCRYHSSFSDAKKNFHQSPLTWKTLQDGCFMKNRSFIL